MQDEIYRRTFSRNLRFYMEKNGKSQVDLINDLGFNRSAVSTWCNGTRLPRMDKVDALARYFRINRSDLIEDHTGDPVPAPVPSPMEEELLEHFRLLNDAGKEKAVSYVSDLADIDKYKKVSDSEALA